MPLQWQVFTGAIAIIVFMHLLRLGTEALFGERVPQDVKRIYQTSQTSHDHGIHSDGDELPSMHLLMEPLFVDATPRPEPVAININMTLHAAKGRFVPGRPLLTLPLMIATVPSARYDGETNPLSAHDSRGQPIQLFYRDVDPVEGPRVWYISDKNGYDADGTDVIIISFTAPYRRTDKSTTSGPRVDLRRDLSGGGLMGQGIGFLPVPPSSSLRNSQESSIVKKEDDRNRPQHWNVTLEWDLTGSPAGTHGAWSFGDSDKMTVIGSLDSLITNAIFAIGYLQRFPDWGVDGLLAPSSSVSPSHQVEAPTYWFEPSPGYNMTTIAMQSLTCYTRIANFFHSLDPLRIFIRRIEANSAGFGGTGATQSFLLEYADDAFRKTDPMSMALLLSHETVHEFALLDSVPPKEDHHDPSWQEDEGTWYIEGVASYVGYLVGVNDEETRQDMVGALNDMMQAYYTAPRWVQEMNYGDVLANYWSSTVDVIRVSYSRGFVLLAQLDGLIGEATKGEKSVDDVVLGLYKLRLEERPCTIYELNKMVSDIIGREVYEEVYAAFFRGDLIVPGENCLKRHGLKLVKKDWHRFELGFDTESLRLHKVSGLVKGSNAEKAGVKEGDEIVKGLALWTVEDSLDGNMRVTVLRAGQELDIEWWPRSDEVVEAYGFVEINGEDPTEL